jgi:hypothetical protein
MTSNPLSSRAAGQPLESAARGDAGHAVIPERGGGGVERGRDNVVPGDGFGEMVPPQSEYAQLYIVDDDRDMGLNVQNGREVPSAGDHAPSL